MRYILLIVILIQGAQLYHQAGALDTHIDVTDSTLELMWLEGYDTGISTECETLVPNIEAEEWET